ncbi:MAG: MMPL family transporter [Candidatus Nitrohelix vancouverensis]|uniref:MMPL family transporter n=1 Tax=Candidatus Nitrohelix vancouverensis TaxID=2705534 RepID=A0A7T0G325_9BACT|nr:MAG: MMPL family transporter [Candidatus Nitrohelix vancouverensis]
MKSVLKFIFRKIIHPYPFWILAIALALSGLSLWYASGLQLNSRMDRLLPQSLPLIQDFNKVVAKTGGSGPLAVVLEDLEQVQAEKIIEDLTPRLRKVPGVQFVDSKLPVEFLEDRQLVMATRRNLLELEALMDEAVNYAREQFGGLFITGAENFDSERLQAFADEFHIFDSLNPYYAGKRKEGFYARKQSTRNFYIFIQPLGTVTDTGFTERFVEQIQATIDDSGWTQKVPGLNIKLTGSLIVRIEENTTIVRDLTRSAIVAAGLAIFIIGIYTRSLFALPLIFFPLFLSMTYTFALTRLWVGELNMISGFLVAILLGLGIDYGIHLYIRFKQELLKGQPIADSAELVITQVGRSGMMAMLTTASIFSILITADFKGFSEFGQIATIGIFSAFISYLFLFPALILVFDKIHWLRKPQPRVFNLNITNLYSNTPYFLTALFLLLTITSLFLIPDIKFEYDFRNLRGESPAADYETATTEDFGYAFSPTVVLASDKEHLFHIHQALEKIKLKHREESTIGVVHSLNLFSRKEYDSKQDVIEQIQENFKLDEDIILLSLGKKRLDRLKELLYADPFNEDKIPPLLIKKFTAGDEYLALIFSPAKKNFFDIRNIYQLETEVAELRERLAKQDIEVAILNENLLAAKVMDWVKERGPQAFATALGVVFLLLLLDLRNFSHALKTFLPLVAGLSLTGALMALFQIKLNFINFVMLPSIVGIMIDHCIYLTHHILDYNPEKTIQSIKETGSAIILSALTTLSGYASLNVAGHAGIRSIASVVELGIITCTACALFMLPALFELGHHQLKFKRKEKSKKL